MTYYLIWLLSIWFTSLTWFAAVVWLCVVLYRFLRLPALPWIACCYTLAFIAWFVTPYAMHQLFSPESLKTSSFVRGEPVPAGAWIAFTQMSIEALGNLSVGLLAFGEVAFLVDRVYPEVRSRLLKFLLGARRHVAALGILACICTVSVPIMALMVLWIHGPFTPRV